MLLFASFFVMLKPETCTQLTAFRFETVFGPDATQAVVYNECVEPLLARALNGQNASVFAYGPTGAGITFSFTLLKCTLYVKHIAC